MSGYSNSKKKETLFLQIYEEYHDKVYRLCLGYLTDNRDVEDLCQMVFMNAWNGLDKFRGDSSYGTWIYRIAVNTCLLHLKRNRKRINQSDLDDLQDREDKSGLSISDQELLLDLRKAMKRLPDDDRLVLTLSLEGMKYEEIASIMGLTPNHVGVKINRIKQQLKKFIYYD